MSASNILQSIRQCVPVLSENLYKGNCGRLGVVGGCREYTGAPYFAAITILKMGGDLSHVFCAEAAAPVIKSYSPELIVHPVLDSPDVDSEIKKWIPKLHSIVIGPGLGREEKLLNTTSKVIEAIRTLEKPMVIDADGVYCISDRLNLVKDNKNLILTPNAVEFNNLFQKVHGRKFEGDEGLDEAVKSTCLALGGVTIVRKGAEDVISDGTHTLRCSEKGSTRRCGGQGDLLSGSMALFLAWISASKNNLPLPATVLAAFGGCVLTRQCSLAGFKRFGRSMTTTDMISCIHECFEKTFEHK
ncbi:DgyrCDS12160 [Dimorphilus gyrociliatus]|uniref:ATP-dependent (S)-NAD(P)H-hydrate dehydratase n=1 Tax=Dimorphilus gyrociliatus TaxID=2664684 RepID=A0A7I8W6H7_9ANNE|nr:DgyrCDS12160 [Dimorphilus gyrociliatus]